MSSRVKFEKRAILVDGVETQIIAGGMHYFRVPRELWRDRFEKAVQLGLNCIESYMCWNLHERTEGEFDFSDRLDFEAFIQMAQEFGLYVMMRPGPYICSEWDNGGFPAWLSAKEGIRLRRMNKPYLDAVTRYFDVVMPKLAALQYDNGGPIIAMQVENEYGSYSRDKEYLRYLAGLNRHHGVTVPLFTADGPGKLFLDGGMLDDCPIALNFGSRALEAFDLGQDTRPDDPPLCMEFWCGWFDHWGCGEHHTRDPGEVAAELDDMLAAGGSVAFYMFHGGINYLPGANGTADSAFTPDVTSYDYDALLDEAGDPTPKYFACQEVIAKYAPGRRFGTPAAGRKLPARRLAITSIAPLFENLAVMGECIKSPSPLTFEEIGQDYGYVLYRTRVADGPYRAAFTLRQVRDRANVYLDSEQFFVYYRNDKSNRSPEMAVPAGGAELALLVENLGRINYGHLTGRDRKGITEDVAIEWQILVDWEMWKLPHDNPDDGRLDWQPFGRILREKPAYYLSEFELDEPADTFLRFPGVHGFAWVNGHAVGRYWHIGPGQTLYIPACWLRQGTNRLVVFETDKLVKPYFDLMDHKELNKTIKI